MAYSYNTIASYFSEPWKKMINAAKYLGRRTRYYWYRDTGFTEQVLEELCHIDNMSDFRAVLAAASGYLLKAKYLFNADGSPKHSSEICADASEMIARFQKDVNNPRKRTSMDMGYRANADNGFISGLLDWIMLRNGNKRNSAQKINRIIHDTYYEWEDIMSRNVNYESEKVEKELGAIVCRHCADEDMGIKKLRAMIMEQFPEVDVMAFIDPYGQLLGPAGVCKSMALVVTSINKWKKKASQAKSDLF